MMNYIKDYLNKTPNTMGGDDATRIPTTPVETEGGPKKRLLEPFSEQMAFFWLGALLAGMLWYLLDQFGGINMGWAWFFGTWAILTIGSWIFDPVKKLCAILFGLFILAAILDTVGILQIV